MSLEVEEILEQEEQTEEPTPRTNKGNSRDKETVAKKAPRTFLELLNEANLESLPPHVPSYFRAAVGPPSPVTRRHFCTVCGFSANYTCIQCGMRFCSIKCRAIHNDTRCLKFVA
ncbi:SWR1 complex subunit 6-like [Olea europaea var. sylvestris]|uniref:SWR1 complex subunit 6-like n=1 Tax=Olea europaea var. sylvestris TaxID=158386 RepID=UPI000C1D1BC2|nr:SWR1 complex subunit 6-like [Olea europaea var. sylvestris]